MSRGQRWVVFVCSLLLGVVLFFAGMEDNDFLVALGGPIVAWGGGLYVLLGGRKRGARCERCNQKVPKDAKYCPHCGAEVAGQ